MGKENKWPRFHTMYGIFIITEISNNQRDITASRRLLSTNTMLSAYTCHLISSPQFHEVGTRTDSISILSPYLRQGNWSLEREATWAQLEGGRAGTQGCSGSIDSMFSITTTFSFGILLIAPIYMLKWRTGVWVTSKAATFPTKHATK